MFEKLINLMKDVFTLTYRVDRQEKDIEKIQKQLTDLGDEVGEIKSKVDLLVYAVQSESDKTKFWVEKELIKI